MSIGPGPVRQVPCTQRARGDSLARRTEAMMLPAAFDAKRLGDDRIIRPGENLRHSAASRRRADASPSGDVEVSIRMEDEAVCHQRDVSRHGVSTPRPFNPGAVRRPGGMKSHEESGNAHAGSHQKGVSVDNHREVLRVRRVVTFLHLSRWKVFQRGGSRSSRRGSKSHMSWTTRFRQAVASLAASRAVSSDVTIFRPTSDRWSSLRHSLTSCRSPSPTCCQVGDRRGELGKR